MPQLLRRRQALVVIGSPVAAPLVKHLHPSLPQQEGEWAPRFFEPAELETVTALAERIIPETDTPGAKRALVHQYIDFVLAHGEPVEGTPASGEPALAEADLERPRPSPRERFRAGLVWLDRRSTSLFGRPFARLEPAKQDELLTRLSARPSAEEPEGVTFFVEARRLTIDGYYRSEAGMIQELGFEGRTFLPEFKGCTHPQHHAYRVGGGEARADGAASGPNDGSRR
jgi:hypothetical protein